MDEVHICLNTKVWVEGIIIQGTRSLAIVKSMQNHENINRFQEFNTLRIIDHDLFKFTAGLALSYLELASKKMPSDFEKIFNDFKTIEHIKDMRDFTAHQIDYFSGNGWHPEKWWHKTEEFESDASGSVGHNGELLLGGRLSVNKLIEKSEKHLPQIIKIQEKYLTTLDEVYP